jgi:hypothetical protein
MAPCIKINGMWPRLAGWHNLKDAKANYLWSNVAGTGSIGLSFEQVLEKPKRQTIGLQQDLIKRLQNSTQLIHITVNLML